MAEETTAVVTTAVSPTGFPMLPPKLVPWIVGFATIAFAISQGGLLPEHTIGAKVADWISGLAMLLGLVSPGLRKTA